MSEHIAWKHHCQSLKHDMKNKDIYNFMNFKSIRETMFVGNPEYTINEFNELKEKIDIAELDDCDNFSKNHQHQLYSTTGNTIHHRYHLYIFEQITQIKISNLSSIIELGGGYGNMARIIRKMGFNGNYNIVDLPEFCELQKFYLNQHNLDINHAPDLNKKYDLFIATWSLSEIPLKYRYSYEKLDSDYFLISFGPDYFEIDNMEYFKNFCRKHKQHKWTLQKTKYLDNQYYLIGIKNV